LEHFTIRAKESGERLDRYLVERLSKFSRNDIKSMIDDGRVKVNGRRVVIAKWELLENDKVDVRLSGFTRKKRESGPASRETKQERPAQPRKKTFIKVVHEDRDIIVVDKPAGVSIQSGSRGGSTYVDDLRAYLQRKHKSRGAHVKAVHRLDKDTTGLMVFAKSKVGEKLIGQFKEHTVSRLYLTIVDGAVKDERGKITYPITKGDFGHGRRAGIGRKGEGAKAVTLYLVKERYSNASFLQLELHTGRTHQARVHLAALGHPIAGDRTYGKKGGIRFNRQALHSSKLIFKHPASGKKMNFRSNLPDDMAALVDQLRG